MNEGKFTCRCMFAAFVLQTGEKEDSTNFNCVAIGTGSKCMGKSRLVGDGSLINDSHAEVIARRSLTRWIMQQIVLLCEQTKRCDHDASKSSTEASTAEKKTDTQTCYVVQITDGTSPIRFKVSLLFNCQVVTLLL